MGVKNVVNIPSENVDSALSLSPEDFKVKKNVILQHNNTNDATPNSVSVVL